MLFKNYYFRYSFPQPQYLGAKYSHLSWIESFIPHGVYTALDAFGGSQSVSYLLKQMGIQTITNDFLCCNHQIGLSLIENKTEHLTSDDVACLITERNVPGYDLIQRTFANIFFKESETYFLDSFRANVECLKTKYKKALALTIMNRSLTRKVAMGHFAHTQALNYAADSDKIKRNPSLIRSIRDIFLDLLPQYNQAIFDNGQTNKSYCANILDLLPTLKKGIDLVYFDPPYYGSHADYQSFYHFLETYTMYWKDKKFINKTHRYEPKRASGFDKKKDILQSFHTLFELAKDIPYWLISYNNRSYPNIDELTKIISLYRNISIREKTYQKSHGGRGSVAGSREILFICQPKKSY